MFPSPGLSVRSAYWRGEPKSDQKIPRKPLDDLPLAVGVAPDAVLRPSAEFSRMRRFSAVPSTTEPARPPFQNIRLSTKPAPSLPSSALFGALDAVSACSTSALCPKLAVPTTGRGAVSGERVSRACTRGLSFGRGGPHAPGSTSRSQGDWDSGARGGTVY